MPAYAIAHLRSVDVGPEIVEYLDRIDATLEPFGGRFIIHGATPEVLEDAFPGVLVVIEFPTARPRRRGTHRPRTRRSCRCAGSTPTARRSSWTA